jgi:hypothetical protein
MDKYTITDDELKLTIECIESYRSIFTHDGLTDIKKEYVQLLAALKSKTEKVKKIHSPITHRLYTVNDTGCYMDESIHNDTDVLNFLTSHGFDPSNVVIESITDIWYDNDVYSAGLKFLNANCCDDMVFFEFMCNTIVLTYKGDYW